MEQMGINTADLAILIILLFSGALALFRGLVREVVVFGVWVGSLLITAKFYPMAKVFMIKHIHNEMGAGAAATLSLFCASLIILIPLGSLISSFVKGQTLTAIDRSLGFVFGLVRGLLIVCLLYLGAQWIWSEPDKQPDWFKTSKARPIVAIGADMIRSLVPEDQIEAASEKIKEDKKAMEILSDHVNQLNRLSTPVPETKPQLAPSYGEDSRDTMNKLINEKAR